MTCHEVDNAAIKYQRYYSHRNQVTQHLGEEIGRNSVETTGIFMAVMYQV